MQFKKQICLFLAFFLLVSNIGFAFSVHYCDNTFASISFITKKTTANSEKDCCGVVEQKSHCCSDKVVHFEKKTDQATVFTIHLNAVDAKVFEAWHPIVFVPFSLNENDSNPEYSVQSHAPPLYKLYSQYVFYDSL
jgi:hypothetical protein